MEFTTLFRPKRQLDVVGRAPGDHNLPGECYERCNDAFLAAQVAGKSDKLCAKNSDFNLYYGHCYSCILALGGPEDTREIISSYLDPTFSEYITYCQEQQSTSHIDPSWYTPTTTWAIATYTMESGPTTIVTVLVDTTVLRPDWTGFQTTTTSVSRAATTTTTKTISQASTITSSQSLTAISLTSSTPDKSITDDSSSGTSPWVWAIVGAVIALALIGLGIILFLYRKGKLRSLKQKLKIGRVSAHTHELNGDSTWRTGDKPELHGESCTSPAVSTPVKEIYTKSVEPKELDSSVRPVELAVEDFGARGGEEVVELPAEVTSNDEGGTKITNANTNGGRLGEERQ